MTQTVVLFRLKATIQCRVINFIVIIFSKWSSSCDYACQASATLFLQYPGEDHQNTACAYRILCQFGRTLLSF